MDMQGISGRITPLLASIALMIVIPGCEKSPSENETSPTDQAAAKAPQASEDDGPARKETTADDDRFEVAVGTEEVEVEVGAKQGVDIAIEPGSGLKINTEYPWKIEFHENDGVSVEETTLSGDAIDLSEKRAAFSVNMTPNKPGTLTVSAVGNFSVCNDKKCHILRDQPLEFEIAATQASNSDPSDQNE